MSAIKKQETDAEKALGCIAVVATLPFTSAYHAIVSGYVVRTLWGWFVTPAFGVAVPSLPLTIGLLLVVAWLRLDVTPSKEKAWSELIADAGRRAVLAALLGGIVLTEGWIIHRVWL